MLNVNCIIFELLKIVYIYKIVSKVDLIKIFGHVFTCIYSIKFPHKVVPHESFIMPCVIMPISFIVNTLLMRTLYLKQ